MLAKLGINVQEIAEDIKRVASEAITEEDLRINVEHVIKNKVIERLKELEKTEIPYGSWKPAKAKYEVTLVSGVRPDALYGHVIIEYERPRTFESMSGFEKAIEQVKRYIIDHAQVEARYSKYFGVVLDGYKIGFVRYREGIKNFESKGPYDVNVNTVAKLVEAIIGLRRKALTAEELLKDFGPDSNIGREAVRTFYRKLLQVSPRTNMLFEDWKRVFSQVCAYSPEKIKGLEKVYGLERVRIDPEKLLFAVHTYYALIMKLLAAEVASLYLAPRIISYLRVLEDAYYVSHERLRDELRDLEEGGIFSQLGIMNFMEADYFAWYLDEWDEELARSIMGIVNRLSDYDPTIAELEPERIRDLFKRLYQNLVPKDVRHDLGEYYTPDWLADLVLNEVGWVLETFERKAEEEGNHLAPLELRLLDPACGSGTFLVLAISRLRAYIEEHWIDKQIALRKITKNIVGFDLNPLAVIASRANYLIALGDMLREKGAEPIEIPVYLADSILVERRGTIAGETYVLRTIAGEFSIPASIIENGLLMKVLSILQECINLGYTLNEFKARISREMRLDDYELEVLGKLFNTFMKLEKEGKNRIWARVLKNSFAPFFTGKFDYVVGNPPWINWENLPEDYRESTKALWSGYGLLEKTKGMGLGKVKRDMAMLFVARCLDRYVKEGGFFGFLIPLTLFKTQAGAGFRKHIATTYKVLKVHDLVTLFPFEGAVNRTSLIIIQKSGKTSFPIQCIIWHNPKSRAIETTLSLEEVINSTRQYSLDFLPIEINKPESPWMQITKKAYDGIRKILGESPWYDAHAGVYTGLNQVYWIDIISEEPDGLLITNPPIPGQKKSVRQVRQVVEKDLVYPLIRGRDIKKWYCTNRMKYILLPVDNNGNTLSHSYLKLKYPKTWKYFNNFFQDLINRGGEPYKSKLRPYRKERFEKAEKMAPPFYWLFNVKPSLASYKVVWKEVSARMGAGGFHVAVIGSIYDRYLGTKVIIPEHTVVLIPLDNEDEAHYLAAILNSSIFLLYGTYMPVKGLENVRIPKFDLNNPKHRKLSELSKEAHEVANQIFEKNKYDLTYRLQQIEEEIDKHVAELYGISSEELIEIKRTLSMLKGVEFEEEMEAEEVPKEEPDLIIGGTTFLRGTCCDLDLTIVNPYNEPLKNVKIKVKLQDNEFEKLLEEVTDKTNLSISLGILDVGQYEVNIVMEYSHDNHLRKVEKNIPLYVKHSEEGVIKRSRIDELFGD
ncbi:MAG: class I SAM-dependent DNA methyltransferase [Candidatus Bathyarchaeia archaeon]